jgi:hypothetical protein
MDNSEIVGVNVKGNSMDLLKTTNVLNHLEWKAWQVNAQRDRICWRLH